MPSKPFQLKHQQVIKAEIKVEYYITLPNGELIVACKTAEERDYGVEFDYYLERESEEKMEDLSDQEAEDLAEYIRELPLF